MKGTPFVRLAQITIGDANSTVARRYLGGLQVQRLARKLIKSRGRRFRSSGRRRLVDIPKSAMAISDFNE